MKEKDGKKRIIANRYELAVLIIFASILTISALSSFKLNLTGLAIGTIDEETPDGELSEISAFHIPKFPTTNDMVTTGASVYDENGIKSVTVYVDNLPRKICDGNNAQRASCNYTRTYTAGRHTYFVSAINSLGTKSNSEVRYFSVTKNTFEEIVFEETPIQTMPSESINGVPSVVAFYKPQNAATTDIVNITATAYDTAGVNYVTIYVDNLARKSCTSNVRTQSISCSYLRTYTSGKHSYRASAGNSKGGIGYAEAGNLDVTKTTNLEQESIGRLIPSDDTPLVSELNPPSVFVYHSPSTPRPGSMVYIVANATDNAGISSVTIFIDGQKTKVCFSPICIYSFNASKNNYTYYATTEDTSGNTGRDPQFGVKLIKTTYSGQIPLSEESVAASAPSVSIYHFPPGNSVVGTNILFNANATDIDGLRGISIYVDGSERRSCYTYPNISASCGVYINNLTVGNHSYYATALDVNYTQGRAPLSGTYSLFVKASANDLVAPNVSVSHTPSNPIVGQPVTITATASDNVGVYQVDITVDSNSLTTKRCYANTCSYTLSNLAPGTHSYFAFSTDTSANVGYSGTKTFGIAPDTTAPTITITNPQNKSTVTQSFTTLRATTSENAKCLYGRAQCTSSAGCTSFPTLNMTTTGGTTHMQSLTNLQSNYTYTVAVSCADVAGNSRIAYTTFFVKFSGGGGTQVVPE